MSDAKVTLFRDATGAFSQVERPEAVHVVRGAIEKGLRAPGPLLLAHGSSVAGDIQARGGVHLARNASVSGSIHAMGDIILGAGATVTGDVRAEGKVVVQSGARIGGTVDAAGDVHLLSGSRVTTLLVGGDLHVRRPVVAPKVKVKGRVFMDSA